MRGCAVVHLCHLFPLFYGTEGGGVAVSAFLIASGGFIASSYDLLRRTFSFLFLPVCVLSAFSTNMLFFLLCHVHSSSPLLCVTNEVVPRGSITISDVQGVFSSTEGVLTSQLYYLITKN